MYNKHLKGSPKRAPDSLNLIPSNLGFSPSQLVNSNSTSPVAQAKTFGIILDFCLPYSTHWILQQILSCLSKYIQNTSIYVVPSLEFHVSITHVSSGLLQQFLNPNPYFHFCPLQTIHTAMYSPIHTLGYGGVMWSFQNTNQILLYWKLSSEFPRTPRIKKLLLNSFGSSQPVSLICQSRSGLQDCTHAVVCVMATWPLPFTQDRSSVLPLQRPSLALTSPSFTDPLIQPYFSP